MIRRTIGLQSAAGLKANHAVHCPIYTFQKSSVYFTQKSVSQAVLTLWKEGERESRHIVSGRSMLPFIGDGARVVIKHTLEGIKFGSILAFKKDQKIVVHRVIKIEKMGQKTHFITKGDLSPCTDPVVFPEEIIGKVTAVVKESRTIPLDNRLHRFIGYGMALLSLFIGRIRGVFKGGDI